MIFLFVFIFSVIEYYQPTQKSIIHMQNSIRKLSSLDEELGQKSESISTKINHALNLNVALKGFHLGCGAALASNTLPALQSLARGVAATQNFLLATAHLVNLSLNFWEFEKDYNPPQRGLPVGPCQLPNTLECKSLVAFRFKHIDSKFPAGTYAEYKNCEELHWRFKDERVNPL